MYQFFFIFIISLIFSNFSISNEMHSADSHGPITIMGDHIHKEGDLMFSYRFIKMKMNDVFNGSKNLTTNEIMSSPNGASNGTGSYMNAPTRMNMDMHMFGAMYAPTNSLTIMAMTDYSQKEMTQQRNAMGGNTKFDIKSYGLGDVSLTGLYRIYEDSSFKSHVGLGMSFPTGSINKRDATPVSTDSRLGYGMQNGSGTYDPFVFLNTLKDFGKIKLGGQIYYKMRASGKNQNGYEYGNVITSKVWTSYKIVNFLSTSLSINYKNKRKMNGADDEMNPRMSSAMDSRNQGYQKLNLGLGMNFINHGDTFKNHRIGLEVLFPVYQRYRGIQMSEHFKTVIGWQYGF